MYDVFQNIRDDEAEHCMTMRSCQSSRDLHSPHSPATAGAAQVYGDEAACVGFAECVSRFGSENWSAMKEEVFL